MENALLPLLCSPVSHAPLRLARPEELEKINTLIRGKELMNQGGSLMEQEIDQCLISDGEARGFPVRGGLPHLLLSESFAWP